MAYHSQQGVDTGDRPHLQHLRPAHAPQRRPRDRSTFLHQALEGKPLTVFGDGSQTRSLCYVDDLIRGLYLLAMSRRAPAGQHRQPRPRADDARARRDRASASRARRARSCSRRCRSTTRRCAGPTSRGRGRSSAGSRRSTSRRGCGAGSRALGREPVERLACAAGGSASPSLVAAARRRGRAARDAARATCSSGSTTRRSRSTARSRRPSRPSSSCTCRCVRLEPLLGRPARAWRRSAPPHPTDPADPAYDWALYDRDRRSSVARRTAIKVLFSIYGTPSWANGGAGLERRADGTRSTCKKFARAAAAERYSGTYAAERAAELPAPSAYWLAWNEPNNPVFLTPQFQKRRRRAG